MCDAAMKRIKREVEDYYGDAAPAASAAPTRGRSTVRANTAAAAATGRAASASRTRAVSQATKDNQTIAKQRLIAKGIKTPSVAQIAQEVSEMITEKLSPDSQPLRRNFVKYKSLYDKYSGYIKANKFPEGETLETITSKKAAAKVAYQEARDALKERPSGKKLLEDEVEKEKQRKIAAKAPAATSGGRRRASRKSRSRRASRKQRRASRKSRRSRRSMRR